MSYSYHSNLNRENIISQFPAGIKESTNQEDPSIKHLTEQRIIAMAPNANTVANTRKLVKNGGFTRLALIYKLLEGEQWDTDEIPQTVLEKRARKRGPGSVDGRENPHRRRDTWRNPW